jgi:hypothetical protein
MLGIATSVFGGPIVGVLGSVVSGVVGYFEKKQQIESDKLKFQHEEALLDKQIAARTSEMESEEAIAGMAADAAALKGSYRHDASYGETGPIIASVLRLVRPMLTLILIGLVALIVVLDDSAIDRQGVALKVLFLAEVAVTWWFADRRKAAKS